jgi:membrane protein YqaA with SNARE-associated domain
MSWLRKHALDIAAFIWGVAEATLFFFVPDVILSYIGLKRGAKAAARASAIAAIGAGVGGAVMAAWSLSDPETARAAVLAVPAISEAMAARAAGAVAENWFLATLLGPLSSTPFKLSAILAPHAGASVPAFALAGVIARLPRFLAVSIGVSLIGRMLGGRVSPRLQTWTLVAAWVLFYAAFFARMPN